jgi:hypothetical protein
MHHGVHDVGRLAHAYIISPASPQFCTAGVYAFVHKRPGFGISINGYWNHHLAEAVRRHLRTAKAIACGHRLRHARLRLFPVYCSMITFGLRDVSVIPLQVLQHGSTATAVLEQVVRWERAFANANY